MYAILNRQEEVITVVTASKEMSSKDGSIVREDSEIGKSAKKESWWAEMCWETRRLRMRSLAGRGAWMALYF